jgi:hypothetical protein
MYRFVKKRTSPREMGGGVKLSLLLSGFSEQSVVSVDNIVRAIDGIPGFHLEGLREIVYLPDYAPAATVVPCTGFSRSGPMGEFVQRERRIFVYRMNCPAVFFQMLHHEIGHFVFFLVIGSRVKKRWVTEISPNSRCVTAYAAVSPWEDFAETYAYYLLHRQSLENQLPNKLAFMRDHVFSGRPESLKQSDRE